MTLRTKDGTLSSPDGAGSTVTVYDPQPVTEIGQPVGYGIISKLIIPGGIRVCDRVVGVVYVCVDGYDRGMEPLRP